MVKIVGEDGVTRRTNRFLLTWPSARKEPELVRIQVVSVDHAAPSGAWVYFKFLEGAEEGNRSGAPICNVLTEAEANLVRQKATYLKSRYEEAKAIQAEAKEEWEELMANFSLKNREV